MDLRAYYEALRVAIEQDRISLPTSQEMADGLAVRRIHPLRGGEVIPQEMFWEPKPSGWAWEKFAGKSGHAIKWFGVDWAEGCEPKPELSEDDKAVHRAIAAMQRPARAHEL